MAVIEMIIQIPNEPGRLSEMTDLFSEKGINIRAMDISIQGKTGTLSLVADNHAKGVQVCKMHGYAVQEREVAAVWVPDHPGGLNSVLKPLRNAQINVEKLYLAASRSHNNTAVILEVSDIDAARQALTSSDIKVIDDQSEL